MDIQAAIPLGLPVAGDDAVQVVGHRPGNINRLVDVRDPRTVPSTPGFDFSKNFTWQLLPFDVERDDERIVAEQICRASQKRQFVAVDGSSNGRRSKE